MCLCGKMCSLSQVTALHLSFLAQPVDCSCCAALFISAKITDASLIFKNYLMGSLFRFMSFHCCNLGVSRAII